MAYEKVPRPSTVYHLTQKGNLDSILDDGRIRRFDDTECWFCESLDKMRAYMAQTVLCEGKPYYAVGGQLCRYPKFVPEDYVLLKLTPRGYEDNWYRWNQEIPPGSSRELMQAAKEFSMLKIGYRGDMAFKEPEVIDVPKFLSGEIVSHKELTSSEMWGLIFERTEAEMAAYLAPEVYQAQANEIGAELAKLKNVRQEKFNSKAAIMLDEVKKLKMLIFELEEPLEAFDEKLFLEIVKSIQINKEDEMSVEFLGGLRFRERI